ncbi:RNA polymerase-associated protein RapA [Gilvimarinus polysaccharolyticus]|uniref:RNA polymerase-associated protein RapA n=1 Tax=Gilvimarinus polysaccharolyticus TaxID=863921 RepID=UPI00067357E6|nr:RNA polymerase-associated protein RapA [Gilvimarinus polysaccharolyticus]
MSQTVVTVGQRYVSDTEPELGLGVVLQVEGSTVDIGFPAAEQRRTYSLKEAPLSRVRYAEGERVKHQAGQWLVVQQVIEQGGCLLYQALNDDGEIRAIPEFELDSFVQFSKPRERLFSGQIDRSNHFALRYRSQNLRHQIESTRVFGLAGPKVSLLPHQLYIAEQVASRFAPRVLLADEVGLGKTIEAGLILHRQLLTGRTQRALVVVPPALLHQWLVEMLRRFNLSFTLLDEERCQALDGTEDDMLDFDMDDEQLLDSLEADEINPFESAQLVLCSLDFLTANPQRLQQALAAEWDMLLVDEAHHLSWSPSHVSDEYIAIEQLASRARGLLLLTATPEQLGLESHFARLRLLDPDRYYDFATFIAEQQSYKPLSDLVEQILAQRPDTPEQIGSLPAEHWSALAEYLDADAIAAAQQQAEQQSLAAAIDELVTVLLDRHGTGRVLLRNTRHAVKGFPTRHLHEHPIALDSADAEALAGRELASQLHPEYYWAAQGDWWLSDPRVAWLKAFIKARRGQKILVICADSDTAQELELYLRLRQGVASAVFHENMNLIARDRAAAYFADMEDGAQVLIASEIGSEGRNFQFAQDLVLFDLPLNPDLLEQRIGRLDRIGQAGEIHLHVPLYTAPEGLTAQEKLARWYHEGINAFTHTCAIGHAAFARFGDELTQALSSSSGGDGLNALVDETAAFSQALNAELQAGRDRLLELNSCRPQVAAQLVEQLQQQDEGVVLPDFLMRVLDSFNVDYERHSENSWVLHPGEHMKVDPFPGLPESGLTITFDRQQALERDDISFATWEHPLVRGALELILDTEFGNTAVATLKLPPLKPGTLMVEAVFCLHCPAPQQLQLTRYLQDAVMRVLLDVNGKNFAAVLSPDKLAKVVKKVPRVTSQELVRHSRAQIAGLLDRAEEMIAPERDTQVNAALASAQQLLGAEISRLQELAKVNPNVRQTEIDQLQQQLNATVQHLEQASLKLDAVRVIVAV